MTPDKMIQVVTRYEKRLQAKGVFKERMQPRRTFGSCTEAELLAHAYYLSDNVKEFANDPTRWGRANRHFTAMQMCLSFANWYTLEELMRHNKE